MLVYLNSKWRLDEDAETLFLDTHTDTGILVRPRPGRVILMDQDIMHRVSMPSKGSGRPRYSLVWKLVFGSRTGEQPQLLRPEWGRPCTFGSAHRMALVQDALTW